MSAEIITQNIDQNIDQNNMETNEFPRENREDLYVDHAIFRFKFTEDFMKELYHFSKIHQYDHRKDFKEAWLLWLDENIDIVRTEVERLIQLGYNGDIIDKMFKSARYYFRKKSSVKVVPKKRRQYISINHKVLEAMDEHIKNNRKDSGYQPKNGFISFCKDNEIILKECIKTLMDNNIKDGELIENKLKKTYKNRYFMLITK
jgi:hypothetical protein